MNEVKCKYCGDSKFCPFCELLDRNNTLEEQCVKSEDDIAELTGQIEELEDEIEDLKTQLMGKDND